jgi:hypothetical protein
MLLAVGKRMQNGCDEGVLLQPNEGCHHGFDGLLKLTVLGFPKRD